ncbi:hypothetical protein Tco_0084844 [Tanacetum coccineum]
MSAWVQLAILKMLDGQAILDKRIFTELMSKLLKIKPKVITPDLSIEEPDNSLNMGDKHLDTIPSIENLVLIPSEFKGISEDTCDVPVCEDPSTFDALSNHSEILSDSNNDGDSFFEESDTSFSHLDNSLPKFETFSDHTEETRSSSTTTHANNSLPEYDSFIFEVELDQGGLTSIVISDNSNNPLLELPEFESFHFDLDLSFHRPPPEPPDVEISLIIETNAPVMNNFDNEDECFDPGGGEINVKINDSFTFVIWTFIPFLTYPEVSPLLSSTKNEDTIFDPGIST